MTTILLEPHWRKMDELFSPEAQKRLTAFDVIWGRDDPMPEAERRVALRRADVWISTQPALTGEELKDLPRLNAIIEVSGAFPDTLDYPACFERGLELLSCAPGFRAAVAEMGLAMALSAGRGLTREHEAFRTGTERWLDDCPETDFTLFGARVGFVGFGQIAQETARLMAPFAPEIRAHDPWLPQDVAAARGIDLSGLLDLARWAQVLFITAAPSCENRHLINAQVLAAMPDHATLILLSRAHLTDFDAVTAEAASGRLTVATDVFPTEPLDETHPLRALPNVLLSPHRAAAAPGGRHLIGDMICDDLDAMVARRQQRRLARANPKTIVALAGVGDATIDAQADAWPSQHRKADA